MIKKKKKTVLLPVASRDEYLQCIRCVSIVDARTCLVFMSKENVFSEVFGEPCVVESLPRSEAELSICTWNILAHSYTNPAWYEGADVRYLKDFEVRIRDLISIIRLQRADVLCLQEVEKRSFEVGCLPELTVSTYDFRCLPKVWRRIGKGNFFCDQENRMECVFF